jgi:hypothetical protein
MHGKYAQAYLSVAHPKLAPDILPDKVKCTEKNKTYQPSKRPSRHKQVHVDTLVLPEVPAQVLGERLDRGFAGVVRRVAGRVGDALLAACNDDGGGGGIAAGLKGRDVGVQAVDNAEEVGGEDLWGRGRLASERCVAWIELEWV